MWQFSFQGVTNVLCLGAHADDIEIGCGGTLLSLAAANPGLRVHWVVFSAEGPRAAEARRSARLFLQGVRRRQVVVKRFRTSFFPSQLERIKMEFERIKTRFQPDVIFTHQLDDRHQDHRVLAELTWNTFRHHWILEYEIPKYDGDLRQPNVFVPLASSVCRRKVAALLECFASQRDKHWFTEDLFLGLMRLRGIECASPTGHAEAFHGRKLQMVAG
jgi:LmbE family N-acetylglucosaminyl deacetylase